MKRILFPLMVGAIALSLQAQAQPSAGVVGTMHDLSATGFNTVTNATEVCVFCHTPHNSASAAAQIVPLWNHTSTAATYTMYNTTNDPNSTITGTVDNQPTGSSLACLSCHDGTVAVGSLVNTPSGTTISYAGGAVGSQVNTSTGLLVGTHAVGTDLSNDHPISITYDEALDTGLRAKAALVGVELFNGKVQCASCHDVHNWADAANGGGAPFLRVDNLNSGLCLKCHIK